MIVVKMYRIASLNREFDGCSFDIKLIIIMSYLFIIIKMIHFAMTT